MSVKVDKLDEFYQNVKTIAEYLEIETEEYGLEDATRTEDLCYKVFETSEDIAGFLSGYRVTPMYDTRTSQRRFSEFSDRIQESSEEDGFKFDKAHLMMFSSLYNSLADYLDLDYGSLNWDSKKDPLQNMTTRGNESFDSLEDNIVNFVESISDSLDEQDL